MRQSTGLLSQQYFHLPQLPYSFYFFVLLWVSIDSLSVRKVIFKKSLVSKANLLRITLFINCQLSFSISLSFEKSPLVRLSLTSLDPFSMFDSIFIVSIIRIIGNWIFQMSSSMKIPFFERSFKGNSIRPLKFTFSVFLPKMILALIYTFVIIFCSSSFRLFVLPFSFVFQACDLVVKNTLFYALPDKIAGVRIYINRFLQIWLKVLRDIAFKITLKISIFFHFIDLCVTFRQVILIFRISIHVNYVDWMFNHPYFVLACSYFCKFTDSFPYMHVSDWK